MPGQYIIMNSGTQIKSILLSRVVNCKTRRESLWLCAYISVVNGIVGAEPRILTGSNDSGEGDELMVLG